MQKQEKEFVAVEWAELDQDAIFAKVSTYPEDFLDHLISQHGKLDLPELVSRTIFAIRNVHFPGDDFNDRLLKNTAK